MLQQVVGGQFKLVNKLPKGCNSQHFEAISIQDGKEYMVKVQSSDQDALLRQATIYLDLQDKTSILLQCGLARCYYAGKEGSNVFIVLDALGPSLEVKLKQCESFRPKTFLTLADQMIKRIEYLHRNGYIHRNIELSKLLMGKHHYSQRLFLVGFTRGKAWSKNGKHIKYAQGRKMRGNALYQSINAHLGLQLSRRDDLESMIYCWAKMLYGKLPWEDEHNLQKMLSKKMENRPALLFKNFPKQLAAFHEQIINLSFDGEPDYDNMRCLINELFEHYKIEPDYFYDWDELQLAKNKFKIQS